LELLRVAARLDLDDLTGTTASGLHLATMGGLWQALAHGFLGLRIRGTTLLVDPCLPNGWNALELRLRVRGEPVAVRAEHDQVRISCRAPLDVMIAGASCVRCVPPGETFDIRKRRS
jgi:trehalose/maltose hydrolase-like predicted phosphorylase